MRHQREIERHSLLPFSIYCPENASFSLAVRLPEELPPRPLGAPLAKFSGSLILSSVFHSRMETLTMGGEDVRPSPPPMPT